jgi:hypothetical protein
VGLNEKDQAMLKEDLCEIASVGIDGEANKVVLNLRSTLPADRRTFENTSWFSFRDSLRKEGLAIGLAAATAGNNVYIRWDSLGDGSKEISTMHLITGR